MDEGVSMSKNILVAYYSQSGQTKRFAKLIAERCNGDLYEIETIRRYNEDMWKAWDEAQAERADNRYPALKGELPDISDYDTIIVGSGVWGYTLANPMTSFMRAMDFTGKRVSAFWTFYDHDEKYNNDMMREVRGGDYVDGLPLSRGLTADEKKTVAAIDEWIKTL